MHKIRAILFDLDNTLVDFIRMKEESCRAAVKAMVASGLQMKEDQVYERLMETNVGIESDRAFSEFLRSIDQFDHKILASGINTYLKTKKFLKPYPNVKSVLGKLKRRGVFLSIVTDAPKTKAYQRLLGMGIEPYFKFIVGYEDTNKILTNKTYTCQENHLSSFARVTLGRYVPFLGRLDFLVGFVVGS